MRADYENRYHEVENGHWWFQGRRDLVSALVRAAGAGDEARILDIGCSGGATLRRLRSDGHRRVTGIDFSAEAVARCTRAGLPDVHRMDAQAPDFPDQSFDLIVASDILEHVPDEHRALHAWFRLLRPGGVLITLVPAFMFMWSAHDEANQHQKRYRLPELRASIESAGFRTTLASYWNFLLLPPAAVLRLVQNLVPPLARAHLDMSIPPVPLNYLLTTLLRSENRLLGIGVRWPLGLSALVVAERPGIAPVTDR